MRKKTKKRRIKTSVLLMYAILLSGLIISFTLARYQTVQKSDASATAAKWSFKIAYDNQQINTQDFQINLIDTQTNITSNTKERIFSSRGTRTILNRHRL